MNPNRTSVCVLWKYSFADGIEKNWNRDEKAIVEPTNYNKLNKQKGLGQTKSTKRKGWPSEGQSIYTLPHIYANRKDWGTQTWN